MKLKLLIFASLLLTGCTVVNTGVFPKFTWYWTAAAKEQRREDAAAEQYHQKLNTNQAPICPDKQAQ